MKEELHSTIEGLLQQHRYDYFDFCKDLMNSEEFYEREQAVVKEITNLISIQETKARIDEVKKVPRSDYTTVDNHIDDRLEQLNSNTDGKKVDV